MQSVPQYSPGDFISIAFFGLPGHNARVVSVSDNTITAESRNAYGDLEPATYRWDGRTWRSQFNRRVSIVHTTLEAIINDAVACVGREPMGTAILREAIARAQGVR